MLPCSHWVFHWSSSGILSKQSWSACFMSHLPVSWQVRAVPLKTVNSRKTTRNQWRTSWSLHKWRVTCAVSCESVWNMLFFSSGRLAHSAWIIRRTAFGKMGKGFGTYRGASITAGSPECTGKTGCSRCTWRDLTPSRRRCTPHVMLSVDLNPCSCSRGLFLTFICNANKGAMARLFTWHYFQFL